MKPIFVSLIVFLSLGVVASQQRNSYAESKFLREFRNLDGINSLLSKNAAGKIDRILTYGPGEQTVERKNVVVLHRSFEVEIGEINNSNQLVINIEASLKRKMEESGLKVKGVSKLGGKGFTLQYESNCETGFTDVRALREGEIFHLYFVFNETFCRS